MAPPPQNGIQRAIGSLEAQVAAATSAIANLTTRWERQDERAEDGRRIMHQKIDRVGGEVVKLSGEVTAQTQEIAEIKNDIGDLDAWRIARENERRETLGERRLIDRISGKVWIFICAVAALIGSLLSAAILEFIKKSMD